MNALFRHLAVRFWLTALVGGVLCMTFLPLWQQILGLHWLPLPAILILFACFWAFGWGMSRLGTASARRQVNEATVWERAGMIAEAEIAFQRATALFDSFWLSPFSRRSQTRRVSGAIARFYLSQFAGAPHTRAMVATYLKNYPQDEALAENWLETLISFEQCLDQEHEAVARVGEALSHHKPIQRLLMQFYLANGRIDFDAQQTYRRVWKEQQPLAPNLAHALARLLRNESIVNPWALQVYIQACQSGEAVALEGVAAGLRLLPANEESRRDLSMAQKLVAGLDAEQIRRMTASFKPVKIQQPARKPPRQITQHLAPIGSLAVKAAGGGAAALGGWAQNVIRMGFKWRAAIALRHMLYGMGIVGVGVLGVLIIISARQPSRPPEPQPPVEPVAVQKPVVVDPFTIQVAAYVKSEDAQRFVDQLTGKKLDAFRTKATSANRTWYQVKISHFPTREAAQRYGQNLKSKGLIDDFYVANYEPQ